MPGTVLPVSVAPRRHRTRQVRIPTARDVDQPLETGRQIAPVAGAERIVGVGINRCANCPY